jgi:hypothetical protein
VAVQREKDLTAWEPVGEPVRSMDRERGLANPGHPADGMDAHHAAGICGVGRHADELLQLLLPAGERADVPRQPPDGRRARHGPGRSDARSGP